MEENGRRLVGDVLGDELSTESMVQE
ncbi:hypothetical protein FRAHR75_580019 [Frankia sp. Hr75.2]|nr:hypothetical protein FRAHR75_580019 [Frankia sp. Hr75.2]